MQVARTSTLVGVLLLVLSLESPVAFADTATAIAGSFTSISIAETPSSVPTMATSTQTAMATQPHTAVQTTVTASPTATATLTPTSQPIASATPSLVPATVTATSISTGQLTSTAPRSPTATGTSTLEPTIASTATPTPRLAPPRTTAPPTEAPRLPTLAVTQQVTTPTTSPAPLPPSQRTPQQPTQSLPTVWPISTPLGRTPTVAAETAVRIDGGGVTLLDVPHRYQFDGTFWSRANCGPASLAMVLGAYGIEESPEQVRAATNQIEGEGGPTVGVRLDALARIALEHGLEPLQLYSSDSYTRWTTARVRNEIAVGRPVITLVHYAALPGNESTGSTSDHFIVVVGNTPDGFLVNDPASLAEAGLRRPLTEAELVRAWNESSVPGQALAIGAGPGRLPVPVAYLSADEWAPSSSGLGPNGATPIAPSEIAPPEITLTNTSAPTVRADLTPRPTRTPVPDRWSAKVTAAPMPTAVPTIKPAVLAAREESSPRDPGSSLAILAAGFVAGAIILRPRRKR